MTMEMKLREREQIGIEQGIAIGEKRGEAKGRSEGIAIGEAKGIHTQAVESAKILKSMNLPIEQIAKATGISIEEINNLK